MHTAGWLHRDISIGNILIDESGHGRLVDLEYAKRMGDDVVPEFRVVSVFYFPRVLSSRHNLCNRVQRRSLPTKSMRRCIYVWSKVQHPVL